MAKILILEDNAESLCALEAIVKQISNEIEVFTAATIEEAREILVRQKKLSLFLLDINLNEKKVEDEAGMEFAKEVRAYYEYEFIPIIFVTSILSMELTSYREIQCYQYITKPFEKEKVQEIIKKILNHEKTEEKEFVLIKKDGINYKIICEDITFIQAIPRGIRIHLRKEAVDVKYLTLKQLLAKLSEQNFLQCHRMFVVNRLHIEYIDVVNRIIKLVGRKESIEIGVTYKAKIREWLNE
ncbi:MAG: LytR/AlgR family response regulator transcription factor [Velocimicrobium sp.]